MRLKYVTFRMSKLFGKHHENCTDEYDIVQHNNTIPCEKLFHIVWCENMFSFIRADTLFPYI